MTLLGLVTVLALAVWLAGAAADKVLRTDPALALAESAELPVEALPWLAVIDVGVVAALLIGLVVGPVEVIAAGSALCWTASTHDVARRRPRPDRAHPTLPLVLAVVAVLCVAIGN